MVKQDAGLEDRVNVFANIIRSFLPTSLIPSSNCVQTCPNLGETSGLGQVNGNEKTGSVLAQMNMNVNDNAKKRNHSI